jgi:hypothetical protein
LQPDAPVLEELFWLVTVVTPVGVLRRVLGHPGDPTHALPVTEWAMVGQAYGWRPVAVVRKTEYGRSREEVAE